MMTLTNDNHICLYATHVFYLNKDILMSTHTHINVYWTSHFICIHIKREFEWGVKKQKLAVADHRQIYMSMLLCFCSYGLNLFLLNI